MLIHNYDKKTKEFTTSVEPYYSPREPGVPLMPAFSTTLTPPTVNIGEVAVFDEDTETWTIEEDHRGQTIYNTTSKAMSIVEDIGPIPTGFTAKVPTYTEDEYNEQLDAWSTPLASYKTSAISLLRSHLREQRDEGYTTSLGIVVDSRTVDRDNVSALLEHMSIANLTQIDFRLFDNSFVTLSLADVQTVYNEIVANLVSLSQLKWSIEAEINAATTMEEVNSVLLSHNIDIEPIFASPFIG